MSQHEQTRNLPLSYLRTLLTLLVVLHHTLLAYAQFAPPLQPGMDAHWIWTAFPVVDHHRWPLADLIIGFDDSFFMSLMFLISGVFAWPSLARKGGAVFLRERALRLGLPFVLAAAVLAPLAYYPTWLASAQGGPFWTQWLSLGAWPAGPAWFLWVLLLFDGLMVLLSIVVPGWSHGFGRLAGWLGERPLLCFAGLLLASALCYLPMAAWFGPSRWIKAGPFFVQISRLPHYLLYFLFGAGLGAWGSSRGLLQSDGRLARRWWAWSLLGLLAFGLSTATLLLIVATWQQGGPGFWLSTWGNGTFVLTCASLSFAMLSLFLRFARRPRHAIDRLGASAYGIYLLHYPCVSWLQLALLRADWPAPGKAALVFAGAVALSWAGTAWLRRLPRVDRVL